MTYLPHDRAWHYAEADRLLSKAAEATKDYVDTDDKARARKEDLGGLAQLLAVRAQGHATLASASELIEDAAWMIADRASKLQPAPDIGPEVLAQVMSPADGPDWAHHRADVM